MRTFRVKMHAAARACFSVHSGIRKIVWSTAYSVFVRESLYSPKLKYGSYRSRDLKLRHRERCVREAVSSPRAIMLR